MAARAHSYFLHGPWGCQTFPPCSPAARPDAPQRFPTEFFSRELSRQDKLHFLHHKRSLLVRRPTPDSVRSIQQEGSLGSSCFTSFCNLEEGGKVTAGCDPSFAQTRVAMRMNDNWPGNGTTNLFVLRSVTVRRRLRFSCDRFSLPSRYLSGGRSAALGGDATSAREILQKTSGLLAGGMALARGIKGRTAFVPTPGHPQRATVCPRPASPPRGVKRGREARARLPTASASSLANAAAAAPTSPARPSRLETGSREPPPPARGPGQEGGAAGRARASRPATRGWRGAQPRPSELGKGGRRRHSLSKRGGGAACFSFLRPPECAWARSAVYTTKGKRSVLGLSPSLR